MQPDTIPGGAPESRKLGDVLVERGLLNEAELLEMLALQEQHGTRLGRLVAVSGKVSRLDVFRALADTWRLPFADLLASPPDVELVRRVPPAEMVRGHWVPLRIDGVDPHRVLVVATAEQPTVELQREVRDHFDVASVEYAVTTDWDIDQAVLSVHADTVADFAADALYDASPLLSARSGFHRWQAISPFVLLVLLAIGAVLWGRATAFAALIAVNVIFTVGVLFKVLCGIVGLVHGDPVSRFADHANSDADHDHVIGTPDPRDLRRRRTDHPLPEPAIRSSDRGPRHAPHVDLEAVAAAPRVADEDLPMYTILVPAYREANVVAKLIEHLGALDYPATKLQVLVLMEADDPETFAAARASKAPDNVRFVLVPPGHPQTKPKACNVGLMLAEGEYLVIYDAEDRPDPDQLRDVINRFRAADDDVVCVQARLNYFNARENVLTRMFTLEYTFWFDVMLPGLDRLRLPIPLGGTSNHFRVDRLRELGGWDPYNVTEDADLGVRASATGGVVIVSPSTTWEEACSEWKSWIRQRTRWIKGYMMTAMVHLREPFSVRSTIGVRGMVGLIGLIAGTPLTFLACPLVWGFWVWSFLGLPVGSLHLHGWVHTAALANLIIGNGSMVVMAAIAMWRRDRRLAAFALLMPLYWLLHSLAAWRAAWQVVFSPHRWEKTPHGIVHGPEQYTAARAQAQAEPSAAR
jgi:cellulose synthase/poly-beta-1,6-N-acetylglucosamine synthase-like glycosyltransferase